MAWTREDWNDIIRRVNDLAQNPDDGCDPVPTLEEVGESHKWSIGDIQAVQDKLTEICNNNSWPDELRLWAQDTIDGIEAAISAGWCNCKEECVPDCSNSLGTVETYLGAIEQSGCVNMPFTDGCTSSCRNAATALGFEANTAIGHWADSYTAYCSLKKSVEDLQDQLATLQDQLAALQTAQNTACAHGETPACLTARSRVQSKQDEIDACQTAIQETSAQRDEKLAEANGYEAEAEEKAAASFAQAGACTPIGMAFSFLSTVTNIPWADCECDELGPSCLGADPRRCRVWWNVLTRTTPHIPGYEYPGPWTNEMSGSFIRSGAPFVTFIRSCSGITQYACSSTDCSQADEAHGCFRSTVEVKLVLSYPWPTNEGETCCDDSGSTD